MKCIFVTLMLGIKCGYNVHAADGYDEDNDGDEDHDAWMAVVYLRHLL
ncbi:MAG: hypothetical protein WBZ36_21605 [Candidatus Nitrosopolaris sp.]